MAKIDVRIPKGFRDLPPEQMVLREELLQIMKKIFWKYGFQPLETPSLEYFEILKGKMGEEAENLLYNFTDRGDRELGMIYDLTVPLSRYVAMTHQLITPFKRYQIQRVWRAEKPQKGRYREFYQCDVDIVGEKGMMADGEIVTMLNEVFEAIGFSKFTININNRKILAGIVEYAGLDADSMVAVCRSIDKMDKIGRDGVIGELAKNGFSQDVIDKIFEVLDCSGDTSEKIAQIEEKLGDIDIASEGIAELKQLFGYIGELGVPDERYEFNLYLSRGLDYYTGPIFETVLTEIPDFGSISGGGRYDNLIGLFRKHPLPAVGTSFGFDRILAAMEALKMFRERKSRTEVLIVPFNKGMIHPGLSLTAMLRDADINAEIYFKPGKLRRQLGYASDRNIPIALILGPDEWEKKEVSLKNMVKEEQVQIPLDEIVERVKSELEKL